MNTAQTISLVTGITGAILGAAGLTISILAFLRDRPRVRVKLIWDLESAEVPGLRVGFVKVTNIGRRAIYIGAVALELPKHYQYGTLLLMESVPGQRLGEGDPPAQFRVNYEKMDKYSADWNRIRAFAEDSAGKKYYSKFTDKKPSWVRGSLAQKPTASSRP